MQLREDGVDVVPSIVADAVDKEARRPLNVAAYNTPNVILNFLLLLLHLVN